LSELSKKLDLTTHNISEHLMGFQSFTQALALKRQIKIKFKKEIFLSISDPK